MLEILRHLSLSRDLEDLNLKGRRDVDLTIGIANLREICCVLGISSRVAVLVPSLCLDRRWRWECPLRSTGLTYLHLRAELNASFSAENPYRGMAGRNCCAVLYSSLITALDRMCAE